MRGEEGLAALLARLPEPKGHPFEVLCAWFLQEAPQYAPHVRQVYLWDEFPHRWGIDRGIDLVVEAVDGSWWAVQAKHRAGPVPLDEIGKFIGAARHPFGAGLGFSRKLLITTSRVTPLGLSDLAREGGEVIDRSVLDACDLDWPEDLADLQRRLVEPGHVMTTPKPLRPHQQAAVADVVAGLDDRPRGQLVMACGTGKTLVAEGVAAALAARRVLVLVPSLALVRQTLRAWLGQRPRMSVAVCSDNDAADDLPLPPHADRDENIESTLTLGAVVTTEADELAGLLRRQSELLIVATYQSSHRVAAAQRLLANEGDPKAFDLVVCDEAHRVATQISSPYAVALDPEQIQAKKRLFVTATPRLHRSRHGDDDGDAPLVASMDDPAMFGPVLHQLPMRHAIADGLLADYRVVVLVTPSSKVAQLIRDRVFLSLQGSRKAHAGQIAAAVATLEATAKFDLNRVLSFHSTVDGARRFADLLPEVEAQWTAPGAEELDLDTDSVSGAMSTSERRHRLDRLERLDTSTRVLIANARCLGEGVDLPELDGVVFADPKRSVVDTVQAVGRAIRRPSGEKTATIVVPAVLSEEDLDATADPADVRRALGPGFDTLTEVLAALKDHDEQLAEQLADLRYGLGLRRDHDHVIPQLRIFADLDIDISGALQIALIEDLSTPWDFWYRLLEDRISKQHGFGRVADIYEGFPLGRWIDKQRTAWQRGDLRPERVRLLERLDGWSWSVHDESWERHYAAVLDYTERVGPCYAMKEGHTEGELNIHAWLTKQRSRARAGQLDDQRLARLRMLTGWTTDPTASAFLAKADALRRYAEKHGSPTVPRTERVDGHDLFAWQHNLRAKRRKLRSKEDDLPQWQLDLLGKIPGFLWEFDSDGYQKRIDSLAAYAAHHGTLAGIKQRQNWEDEPVGTHVNVLRTRRNKLTLAQQKVLEELPGWNWDGHQNLFDRHLGEYRNFVIEHGTPVVPNGPDAAHKSLYSWLRNMRHRHPEGSERRQQIDEVAASASKPP